MDFSFARSLHRKKSPPYCSYGGVPEWGADAGRVYSEKAVHLRFLCGVRNGIFARPGTQGGSGSRGYPCKWQLLWLLIAVYGRHTVDSLPHFRADVWRSKTLALISKAEKNIIVILVFNEWKIYNVMCITIWNKAIIGTKFKHPVQYRFVNAYFDFRLHRFLDFFKIQNRFLNIPRNKALLFDLQV